MGNNFTTGENISYVPDQCRIQGTFGAGKLVWAPKKWAQKIEQHSLLKFHKKTCNSSLTPDVQ